MLARSALNHILHDEGLTRQLGDAEARVLIEWLVDEAERIGERAEGEEALGEVRQLCRTGRALSRFVRLWTVNDRPGATQLAASERLDWPLPEGPMEPWLLMQQITWWEGEKRRQQA